MNFSLAILRQHIVELYNSADTFPVGAISESRPVRKWSFLRRIMQNTMRVFCQAHSALIHISKCPVNSKGHYSLAILRQHIVELYNSADTFPVGAISESRRNYR